MKLDTTLIDLGSLKPCETRIVALPYTNTSCTSDSAIGWTLTDWSSGFNVYGSGRYPPYTLKGNETDTLHIAFDGKHTGTIYDTVVIWFGTDENRVRKIPVQTFVPNVDSVLFSIRMPAKLYSDQEFTADIFPDRSITGKGLLSISGSLRYPSNDLEFRSIGEGAGLSITSVGPNPSGKFDKIDFVLSNPLGISLDPAIPILFLKLRTVLTDTISYVITLDSVILNGSDPDYTHCSLATGTAEASADFEPHCSDSLFITTLQNRTLLLITEPIPNPVTAETHYITKIRIESPVTGIANIQIIDAVGRTRYNDDVSLVANTMAENLIDLSEFNSGMYSIVVRYAGQIVHRKQLLLVR